MNVNVTGPYIYFEIPIFGGIPITQTTVSSFILTVLLCAACIYLGRNLFALLLFKGKKLAIALALDPATHGDPKYHAFDMSGSRRFDRTPMLMRITSPRKVKYAIELLTELFDGAELTNKNLAVKPHTVTPKTKEQLLAEGLIRIEGGEK